MIGPSPHTPVRSLGWLTALAVAALAAALLLLPAASASASTNYTWSGSAASGTAEWSNGTNWGGAAPSGTVGTLDFPALTSSACTASPRTATCYTSDNNLSGLTAEAISIDDGVPYEITGNPITLGAGGLRAAPSESDCKLCVPVFRVPITLSASQTWSISNGSSPGQNVNVDVEGSVTGSTDDLTVNFSEHPFLHFGSEVEVGTVKASGKGTIVLSSENEESGPSLNGSDGNSVSLGEGAGLVAFSSGTSIGPLSDTEGQIQVGQPTNSTGKSGTLAVNGSFTLSFSSSVLLFIEKPGETAGSDYSQISASGAVNLASAELRVSSEYNTCPALTPGNVDTLITTTGSLEGEFGNAPNGKTIELSGCPTGDTAPTVRINYTAHTVTATVVTAGSGPKKTPTETALQVSSATPAVGETVTYTATVTPERLVEAEPSGSVVFLDDGTPIAGCEAEPLTQGLSSSTATCTISYPAAGSHSITARYEGEATYSPSVSTAQTVTVSTTTNKKAEEEARKKHEEEAAAAATKKHQEEEAAVTKKKEEEAKVAATGSVSLDGSTISVQSSGKGPVKLTCTGTATCTGKLRLTVKIKAKKGKKAKTKTIGMATFSVAAGKTVSVTLRINSAGRRLIKHGHGRLKASLTILKSSPAPSQTKAATVHLIQASKKGKAKHRGRARSHSLSTDGMIV